MKKKKIYIVLSVLFSIAFIVILIFLIKGTKNQSQAEDKLDQVVRQSNENIDQEDVPEPEVEEPVDVLAERGIVIPEKNLDWSALQQENSDVYAWILIPGTTIDYPVLQHPTEDSYYLHHNFDGKEGYPGCIYTQTLNQKDFMDPNTVIYGHNMQSGTMFHTLHNFEDGTFFDENRYVYIYTEEGTYVYEIFAAYEFSDVHLLYNFDFETPSSFQVYLDSVFNVRDMGAHIKEDVEVTSDNHIITLSTCTYGKKYDRYLVQAVLINDPTID